MATHEYDSVSSGFGNPLTTKEILSSVLDEQREIAKQAPNLMKRIQQLVVDIQSS